METKKQIKFSKLPQAMELPDLLEMQKRSFKDFLQEDVPAAERRLMGLQAAFLDVFPIESSDGSLVLDFVRYELGEPRFLVRPKRFYGFPPASPPAN
jgi:DNA-directed RNA polymerase subunit beta